MLIAAPAQYPHIPMLLLAAAALKAGKCFASSVCRRSDWGGGSAATGPKRNATLCSLICNKRREELFADN